MLHKLLALLIIPLLIASCCREEPIVAYTEYVGPQMLASTFIGTPDPSRNCPDVGQKLRVVWQIPKSYACCSDRYLEIKLRYRNGETTSQWLTLRQPEGTYEYILLNKEYFSTCGIQAYQINMYCGDEIISTWNHQLWAELIEFSDGVESES